MADRTFGDETIRRLAGSVLGDVAKRANNGGTAGTGGGGEGAAPNGIGDDGSNFTGASLFFLRRKAAMDAVERETLEAKISET